MKWLVVLCLLASPATAATTWTITTRTGQPVTLDVARTPTGYTARFHERQTFWETAWRNYGCPSSGDEVQAAGEVLLQLDRQTDGTFSVKMYKARMYNVGPDGPGSLETGTCVFDSPYTFTGTIVNRAGAAALDHAQVDRYPADHDSFLALHYTSPPCPVPDTAKRTCAGGQWPFNPIIDMPLPDTDGDGINDEWEVGGIREGTRWLDLKSMGADPDHKDLFVQMDSSSDTRFDAETLLEIVAAFAQVPISNPDGTTGIAMHLDAGPDAIMDPRHGNHTWGTKSAANLALPATDTEHFSSFAGGYPCRVDAAPDEGPFTTLRTRNFTDTLRQKVFRYVVLVKYIGSTTNCLTGANWTIPSKWFVIADYKDGEPYSSSARLGTFMHELGHSIGLHHGGDNGVDNYKPNYQSVMNYAYQLSGITTVSSPLVGTYKYSNTNPSSAREIDEAHLAERAGFPDAGESGALLNYKCVDHGAAGPVRSAQPHRAVDLQCTDPPDATAPAPNDVTPTNSQGPKVLTTFNDVAHMQLPLATGAAGGNGVGPDIETITIGDALGELAGLYHDTKVPTVQLSLRKQGGKRKLQLKAKDDVGVAAATITVGSTRKVIMLSPPRRFKKTATQSIDVDLTGNVTVVVSDVVGKTVTATAK